MKKMSLLLTTCMLSAMVMTACGGNANNAKKGNGTDSSTKKLKEEAAVYTADSVTSKSFVVYDENQQGKRPAVLIVPEWWGLGDYVRDRAKQLADMGYVAMAVDMYGNGAQAESPDLAQKLATPFYMNPGLTKMRIDAALSKLKDFPQADMSNVVAIGYCFGGYSVLNAAKLGADLKGVVSFHGNLTGAPVSKEKLKAKVLVCHGGADKFVSDTEVNAFRKSMDSVGADYTFKVYANATHAFTNPRATAKGKQYNMPIEYNPAADSASWTDMKMFFEKVLK